MMAPSVARTHTPLHGLRRLCLYLLALLMAAFSLFPLVIAVGTALKPPGTATSDLSLFPAHPSWSNFSYIFTQTSLLTYVKNSVIVTTGTLVLVLACASLAAYGFSRLQFFLKGLWYPLFLMGLMLPFVVVLVPLFQIEKSLHLFNTYGALILPYVGFGLPFAIRPVRRPPTVLRKRPDGGSDQRVMTPQSCSTDSPFDHVKGVWCMATVSAVELAQDSRRQVALAVSSGTAGFQPAWACAWHEGTIRRERRASPVRQ